MLINDLNFDENYRRAKKNYRCSSLNYRCSSSALLFYIYARVKA